MKICFLINQSPKALLIAEKYKTCPEVLPETADVFVVLGGDGFMLKMVREYKHFGKPFYGINCGNVGFLMNAEPENIRSALEKAISVRLPFLSLEITTSSGEVIRDYAINEIALMRQGAMASTLKITINGQDRITCRGDGILLATPAGSTAYNASAHGPILPLGAHLLALTPLATYSPRHWRGALLKDDVCVEMEVLEGEKRQVNATYDDLMVQDVKNVKACIANNFELLFNPDSSLEERILKEQFSI